MGNNLLHLVKRFLIVCIDFTWEKCIHFRSSRPLSLNDFRQKLPNQLTAGRSRKSEVGGQKTDIFVFLISKFDIRNSKSWKCLVPSKTVLCPLLLFVSPDPSSRPSRSTSRLAAYASRKILSNIRTNTLSDRFILTDFPVSCPEGSCVY